MFRKLSRPDRRASFAALPAPDRHFNAIYAPLRVSFYLVLPYADDQPPLSSKFPKIPSITLSISANLISPK